MYLASRRGDYLGSHRGDPGLFGTIGRFVGGAARAVGSALPGPAGYLLKRAGSVISPQRSTPSSIMTRPRALPGLPFGSGISGQVSRYEERGYRGSVTAGGAAPDLTGGCPKGYRPNKSSYFTKDGVWHEAGTKCVRYRYRNVANGRALKRAISRTAAFDKMVKSNRKALRSLAKI